MRSEKSVLGKRSLIIAAAISAMAMSVHAANVFWDPDGSVTSDSSSGTGTSIGGVGVWTTASLNFWDGGSPGTETTLNVNTNAGIFEGPVGGAVTIGSTALPGNVTTNGLTFNEAATVYTLSSAAGTTAGINLGGTNPFITTTTTVTGVLGTGTINTPIALGANATFNANSTLIMGGNISGNFSVTKNGSGFLTFNGDSSFSGGFTTNQGSIGININSTAVTNSAIGVGPFTVAAGMSFNNNLTANAIQLPNLAQTYSANATEIYYSSGNTPYVNMGTGAITLSASPTFSIRFGSLSTGQTPGGTLVLGGNISESGGSQGFTMGDISTVNSVPNTSSGSGTLVLAGNNSFTGAINLNNGAVNFSNASNLGLGTAINFGGGTLRYLAGNTTDITTGRTITLDTIGSLNGATIDTGANSVTFANPIGNGGNGGLTKTGSGTLSLGATETYTGGTTVNAGTLDLGSSGNINTSTALTMGSGTLSIGASGASQSFSGNTTITGGAQIIAGYSNGGTLGLGALTRTAANGTLNVTLPSSGSVTTTTGNASTIIGGYATVNGTDWAVSNGGNVAALAVYNSAFSSGGDIDAPAGSSTPTSITINSVRFNTPGTATVADSNPGSPADTLTIGTGGILDTPNAGAVTVSPLNLVSGTGEIVVQQFNTANPLTISSNIGSSQSVTKAGPGTLVLSGVNPFTGGLFINGGEVDFAADSALGAISTTNTILLNGGTLKYTGTANFPSSATETRKLIIGSGGATIAFSHSGLNGGGAKFQLNTAGQLTGAGTITVTGPGILGIGNVSNSSFQGQGANWMINGGFVETANPTALGAITVPVTVNTGGEWDNKGQTDGHNVTLNGGTLGNDSANLATFGGQVAVSSASKIRLGDFFDGNNRAITITGPIQGSGNLSIINANSGAIASDSNPTGTSGAPSLQQLTLSGVNMNYTGTLFADAGHDVKFTNPISVIALNVKSTTIALPLVMFNFVPSAATITSSISSDLTGTSEGVIGVTLNNQSPNFNMANIGGGNWFLGTDTSDSLFGTIGAGANSTYRMGGGGAALFLGSSNMLTGNNSVLVGDTRLGGTGTVRYGAQMNYTGNTTVSAGSTLDIDFNNSGTAMTNLMPSGSALILNGGAFTITGRASATFTQTIGGVTLNPGGNGSIQDNTAATDPILLNLQAITRNTGGTINFVLATGANSLAAANGITTTTANTDYTSVGGTNTILGGYATVGGTTWAVNDPTSGTIQAFTGFSGTAFTAAGDTDATANATPITTPGGMLTINSLRINTPSITLSDNTPATPADTLTIASGGILQTTLAAAAGATINVGTLLSANGQDLIVINNDTTAGGAITINSAINTGTTLGLTKSGTGALVLGSANTYSGNTNLNGGATSILNGLALQNSTVSFDLQAGTLLFGNATTDLTGATLGGLSGNQNLALTNQFSTAHPVALTVGGNNASTTYSGVMSGAGSLTQAGNGTLTLSGANTYSGATTVGSGLNTPTLTLNDTGRIASPTVTVNAGGTLNANGLFTGSPDVIAGGSGGVGSTINVGPNEAGNNSNFGSASPILVRSWNSLTIGSGSSVALAPASSHANRTVLVLNSTTAPLTFSDPAKGTFNLSNNDLIVRNGNVAAIAAELASGFNAGAGYWNGNAGIKSSSAAGDTSFLTTLGYRTGSGTFDGVSTTSTDVTVKYTYYGDADLNGTVDGADYQQIDNGFGSGATGWSNGDFNYDGVVNGSDFALIDNTFNQLTATGASPLALVASPATIGVGANAVPEPTTLGLLGIGAMGLLGRRRRRNV